MSFPAGLAKYCASAVSRDGLQFFNLTERIALASFAIHSYIEAKSVKCGVDAGEPETFRMLWLGRHPGIPGVKHRVACIRAVWCCFDYRGYEQHSHGHRFPF